MKRKLTLLVLTLLASAMLAGTGWCADGTKIGLVNFTKLVNSYKRMQGELESSVKRRAQLEQEQTVKKDDIAKLATKLQQHTPESDAYKKTETEIRQKRADLETWTRINQEELLNEDTRIMREVYEDVEAAAADYGRKNAYTLILREDDMELAKATMNELKFKVALRKVLYYDPSIDITNPLVKVLNERYEARAK